jgi:hypothetical protein
MQIGLNVCDSHFLIDRKGKSKVKNFLIRAVKLVAASSGPISGLYSIQLFEKYFALGTETRSDTHTVLVNNHGAYRFITESQYQNFHFYLWTGMSLIAILMVTIVVSKMKNRNNLQG